MNNEFVILDVATLNSVWGGSAIFDPFTDFTVSETVGAAAEWITDTAGRVWDGFVDGAIDGGVPAAIGGAAVGGPAGAVEGGVAGAVGGGVWGAYKAL